MNKASTVLRLYLGTIFCTNQGIVWIVSMLSIGSLSWLNPNELYVASARIEYNRITNFNEPLWLQQSHFCVSHGTVTMSARISAIALRVSNAKESADYLSKHFGMSILKRTSAPDTIFMGYDKPTGAFF